VQRHPAQPSHEVRDELNVVVARGGYGLGVDPFTLSRYVCLTVRVISARQRLEPLIFGICSLSRMSGTLDRRRQRLVVLVDLVTDPSTSLFLLWVPLVSSGPGSYAAAPTTGAAWLDPDLGRGKGRGPDDQRPAQAADRRCRRSASP
jgi:hypothetical protein